MHNSSTPFAQLVRSIAPSVQARVLAFIALARRGVDFDDLRHSVEFRAEGDYELSCALTALRQAGRIERRLASVRYRQGERYLRRDVPVYYLASSAEEVDL